MSALIHFAHGDEDKLVEGNTYLVIGDSASVALFRRVERGYDRCLVDWAGDIYDDDDDENDDKGRWDATGFSHQFFVLTPAGVASTQMMAVHADGVESAWRRMTTRLIERESA